MGLELEELTEAVRYGEAEDVVEIIGEQLQQGTAPGNILNAMIEGIQALGELFKDGSVFLPEVLVSVRAMNGGTAILKPYLSDDATNAKGIVVLGSVAGDIHDIGKNLVGMMLAGNGYRVIDVGIDAVAAKFVGAVRDNTPQIVAMSGLLTTTIPQFEIVMKELDNAGLRDSVKVMVGGAPVTPDYAKLVGADGFAKDCVAAVDEANRLLMLV